MSSRSSFPASAATPSPLTPRVMRRSGMVPESTIHHNSSARTSMATLNTSRNQAASTCSSGTPRSAEAATACIQGAGFLPRREAVVGRSSGANASTESTT
ncbi:hypothetical protein MCOR34_008671 [Pyricularia oryzae]|nr:hypothetical protein MCOR34_008671 [Pyricularia oryzae]KAI6440022.1 hypothetical protein MCOR17_011879 [Pyricularia oryzae]KAI6527700.1 hypothetical protein MCOR16_005643 [Pyricularia oryzae]